MTDPPVLTLAEAAALLRCSPDTVRRRAMAGDLPGRSGLGGWANYETVLRYAHLAPGDLAEEAKRIERAPAQPNLRRVK